MYVSLISPKRGLSSLQASLSTRANQWWAAVPCVTAGVVFLCTAIYVICLLFGYDSFIQVCLLPKYIVDRVQVYRPYTSIVFHASILHLVFNMLALAPIGSGLERILGSVRYLHVLFIMATSNALIEVVIAYLAAYNPVHPYPGLMYECGIGFSGVIFSMIVMETSLNPVQTRSVFGFFSVPAKWYPWALLVLFQLLMPRASLLGHLAGILSGFAYTYGLFNCGMLSSSKYAAVEGLPCLAPLVRRPGFIVGGSGGTAPSSLPSFPMPGSNSVSSFRAVMNRIQGWLPQARQDSTTADERFPGRGQVLGSSVSTPAQVRSPVLSGGRRPKPSSNQTDLHARLLDPGPAVSSPEMQQNLSTTPPHNRGNLQQSMNTVDNHESKVDDNAVASLVAMGFDKTVSSNALIATQGDVAMAVDLISSQD
uniref:UBA domain-containing protein n=1 Tax=Physcomitrium patens TaxID=3218 RepID=A0A7I4EAD2_PHYPA